ncbi:MAG: hypothetical protein WB711_19505 [Terriglobales bacterium]
MKTALLVVVVVGMLTLLAFLYHRHLRGASSGPVAHVRNEFAFTVHAPYKIVAPLFGPEGERGWAGGHWDPQFLYPQPAQDTQGAVFTIRHGHHQAYWINTSFDTEARHFQYVYFIPEAMVVLIDVRFSGADPENTNVDVSYERTALNPEANQRVKDMGDADRDNGKEWATAISDYLAKQKAASR